MFEKKQQQSKTVRGFLLNYFGSMNVPKILLFISVSAGSAEGFMVSGSGKAGWLSAK